MNNQVTKIAYISPDYFFDVDFPILKELNKSYNLIWFPIIPETGSRYSENQIKEFATKHHIKYDLSIRKGRRRHPKQLLFSIFLLKTINKTNPDIIYTEYLDDVYIGFLAILTLSVNKTIYAIHDVVGHSNFNPTIVYKLNKALRRHFIFFHIFSQNQKKIFDSFYSKKQSFYAPLALKDFGNTNKNRPKKNKCKFLFFGAIEEYKGLDLLIKACEEIILEDITDFSLTIAGKGEYWKEISNLIQHKSHFNTRIEFIPDSEIPDLFNSHHFLVLPYLDVTQSGPQMIALNYNLPIIASNHDGFKEYIDHGETGYLFNNKDIDALKTVLKQSINLPQSKYDTLVSNLINKKNTNYLLPEIIERYNQMFQKVLKNKNQQ